jgi:hypothetical protein
MLELVVWERVRLGGAIGVLERWPDGVLSQYPNLNRSLGRCVG